MAKEKGLLSNYSLLIQGVLFIAMTAVLLKEGVADHYKAVAGLVLLIEAGGMIQKEYVNKRTLGKLFKPKGIGTAVAFTSLIVFGVKLISAVFEFLAAIPMLEDIKLVWLFAVGLFLIAISALDFS